MGAEGGVGCFGGGDEAGAGRLGREVRGDELRGGLGGGEVAAVSGDVVEGKEGLAHGEGVGEVGAGGVGVVVAEAAAGKGAVVDDPAGGALGFGEGRGVAADGVELREGGDEPAVLAGVDVFVDAGDALGPAAFVVEFEVGFVVFAVADVCVL